MTYAELYQWVSNKFPKRTFCVSVDGWVMQHLKREDGVGLHVEWDITVFREDYKADGYDGRNGIEYKVCGTTPEECIDKLMAKMRENDVVLGVVPEAVAAVGDMPW